MKCRKPSRTVRVHSVPLAYTLDSWAKVCAAYAVTVSGQIVRRREHSTGSELVGKFGTDAATLAECSLGSEAVSVAGHVSAVCSD